MTHEIEFAARPRLAVSVALCTYNGARFLDRQLASLVEQTRPPDEIVILDDRSSDDTFGKLEHFAGTSPLPVRLARNSENLGYVRNFEAALSATTGAILMPCDQDDVWHPDKIERLAAAIEIDERVMLAHGDGRLIDAAGEPLGATMFEALRLTARERRVVDMGNALRAQLRRNLVTGAACALRRAVLDAARPFPTHLVHDDWLATTAAMLGRIVRIDAPLIDYRQHEGNQLGIPLRTVAAHVQHRPPRDLLWQRAAARLLSFEGLAERLARNDAEAMIELHQRHFTARAQLPKSRLARLPIVAAEALSGRYHECSNGWLSIVRDLVD